jgi:hypothetical protein
VSCCRQLGKKYSFAHLLLFKMRRVQPDILNIAAISENMAGCEAVARCDPAPDAPRSNAAGLPGWVPRPSCNVRESESLNIGNKGNGNLN